MNKIIISENPTFSFPRFWQLLKSDLRINQPKFIRITLSTIGCFLTVAILVSVFAINALDEMKISIPVGWSSTPESIATWIKMKYLGYYSMASFFIFSIGMTIYGSLTFVSMNSKNGRISTLMMPASMLEKYAVRFLEYTIGGLLIMIAGYALGLLVEFISFAGNDIFAVENNDMLTISKNSWHEIFIVSTIFGLAILFGNAFYALGSSIWPRSSWIKTWVCQQIIGVIFLFAGAFGLFKIVSNFINWLDKIDTTSINENAIFWTYVVIFIALIAGCWALAWWRFRNTQIVQRFMKK
ncbi:MAG: hypothetical protein NC095_08720 [Muribaculum sp.]|nr:hypothetical protein [Muribaculum sp.]